MIDVGVNVGKYSMFVLHIQKDTSIYAFEPYPRTYHRLVKNISGTKFRAFNLAVGAQEGELELFNHSDLDGFVHASLYGE